jgi:hypothetical protein
MDYSRLMGKAARGGTAMWQVIELSTGAKVVSIPLSEGITFTLMRSRGAPVFVNIYMESTETRLFDKARLPILTVDGEHVMDLNESIELQNLMASLDQNSDIHCIAEDRQVGARLWNGEEITRGAFILKMMQGSALHVRVFFHPFAMEEYTVSLAGFAAAADQAFAITNAPPPPIDRVAIRSMVEDFWRSFISVAVDNPQIGLQSIQHFDKRIQSIAAVMEPERSTLYLQTVEEERDKLFQEYNRNPDGLKCRLGLSAPRPVPAPVVHHQRQSMGEMAVRTAVRATVWESVISVFRLFR